MVFVWGKSGPSAVAEAAAKPPLGIPDMEMTEGIPSSTVQGVPTMAFLPVSLKTSHAALSIITAFHRFWDGNSSALFLATPPTL